MESNNVGITKEFLENSLKTTVAKFLVTKGSSLGDGYMSVMYSVDVWEAGQENEQPLHFIIKGFPLNPGRQAMADDGRMFAVEVGMYGKVIPKLRKFLKDENAQDIRLPFAPYFGGQYLTPSERNGSTNPLDNYLIMTDLRKTGGYSLRDRFKGLDLDHFALVVEAQAKLHAVSWAYKQKAGRSLVDSFPEVSLDGIIEMFNKGIIEQFNGSILNIRSLFQESPRLQEGLDYIFKMAIPMAKLYYGVPRKDDEGHWTKESVLKNPADPVPNEESWDVLLHGDCWNNNLMFRYDTITGKPVEVVFIDLQVCHEGDPFKDLNYSLYVNTTQELRQKHLSSLLHLYYDTFEQTCQRLNAPLPPGWNWDEFNRRFHRAQIFGVYRGAAGLPLMLQNPNEAKDLDKMELPPEGARDSTEQMKNVLSEFVNVNISNPVMENRVREVLEDGVSQGII